MSPFSDLDVEDLPQIVVDVPFWWLPFALSMKRQLWLAVAATVLGFAIGLAAGLDFR